MEDIENSWKILSATYNEMVLRMKYVLDDDKNILTHRNLQDKMTLLANDLNEAINSIDRISWAIDENYANSGIIQIEINKSKSSSISKPSNYIQPNKAYN